MGALTAIKTNILVSRAMSYPDKFIIPLSSMIAISIIASRGMLGFSSIRGEAKERILMFEV